MIKFSSLLKEIRLIPKKPIILISEENIRGDYIIKGTDKIFGRNITVFLTMFGKDIIVYGSNFDVWDVDRNEFLKYLDKLNVKYEIDTDQLLKIPREYAITI